MSAPLDSIKNAGQLAGADVVYDLVTINAYLQDERDSPRTRILKASAYIAGALIRYGRVERV